jgi:hypothetical protein
VYYWHAKAVDSIGNASAWGAVSKVTVNSVAPVITMLGTSPVTIIVGSTYTDAGATALDNVDGNITENIVTVNPVNINTVGTYTITYDVSDTAGNPATQVTRIVNVVVPHQGGQLLRLGQVLGASTGQVLGAESFHFTLFLKLGSHGNEVMELQKFLNAAGYNCGTPDGKFGPKTKAALIKFQLANGLKGDGKVGPATRALLNK